MIRSQCNFPPSYKATSARIKDDIIYVAPRVYSNNTSAVNQPNFIPVVIETM